jgi:SAM-dependent methyltransferase
LLPQDDQEIHRLDFQHYALRAALGGDYLTPLEPKSIGTMLDVGCGTGRWARERAEEFPLAQVTGLDIESHLPAPPLPENFQFVQANILMGLPFPDHSFDFVHQRFLVGAIPAQQWPSVLRELVRVTRSGGWIELLESGFVSHHAGPATTQFQSWWLEGEKKLGFNLALIPHLDRLVGNAGLRNVQMKTVPLPLGKWGGRAGEMLATDIYAVFASFRAVYVSRFGVPAHEFEEALAALSTEWEHYHTRYECSVVYGRR